MGMKLTDTVGFAKQWLWDRILDPNDKGHTCLVCNRFTTGYSRTITAGMARALLLCAPWFEAHPGEYLKMCEYLVRNYQWHSGDHAKLVYWGILEKKGGERDDGSPKTGYYRITEKGRDFVYRGLVVPRIYRIYDDEIIDVIHDGGTTMYLSLDKENRFNYEAMMNNYRKDDGDSRQGALL